jgi:hypothetical protein
MKSTNPMPVRISETMKKGSNEGITILNQVNNPSYPLSKDNFGYLIIPTKIHSIINKKRKLVKDLFID